MKSIDKISKDFIELFLICYLLDKKKRNINLKLSKMAIICDNFIKISIILSKTITFLAIFDSFTSIVSLFQAQPFSNHLNDNLCIHLVGSIRVV